MWSKLTLIALVQKIKMHKIKLYEFDYVKMWHGISYKLHDI